MTDRPAPNIQLLHHRAMLLRSLRQYFDDRDFLEVQPPCLSRDCVVDPYIEPIRVESSALKLAMDLPKHFYLQTSPELAMKRLLAAGAPSIYSIGPVFRSGENGDQHNVEFTMLEWYALDSDGDAAIELLGELASNVLSSEGYSVLTYRNLFLDSIGIDPITVGLGKLQAMVAQIDTTLGQSIADDRDAMLDVILSQQIQPQLGYDQPVIVKDYPLSQAALARTSADDPQCAARFELFVSGVEIANGYDELTDADVLIERAHAANEKRAVAGFAPLAVESSLVDAMRQGLPACAGVALGVDRLLMVQCDEKSMEKVMPFRIEFS